MAIVMQFEWEGITTEQYDQACDLVNWEGNVPSGAIFHVAGIDKGVFRVTDVWESEAQFNDFLYNRLMPQLAPLNFPGEPTIRIYNAHKIFAPAYERDAVGV